MAQRAHAVGQVPHMIEPQLLGFQDLGKNTHSDNTPRNHVHTHADLHTHTQHTHASIHTKRKSLSLFNNDKISLARALFTIQSY